MSKIKSRKHASNHFAWAIGHPIANGFKVRKIVWGLLMAQYERREDEQDQSGDDLGRSGIQ